MTPMLGITASQISGHLVTDILAYDSIQTVTLTTTTAYVDFTSIPGTYRHLQIKWIGKSSATAYDTSNTYMQFNGDTANNYSMHVFYANQTPSNATYGYFTGIYAPDIGSGGPNTNANFTNQFSSNTIDILNYAATDKYKTSQSVSTNAAPSNYYSAIERNSHNWRSTSAITSIRFAPVSSSWAANTTVALYGIK